MKRLLVILDYGVIAIEVIVAVGLIVMAVGAAVQFAVELFHMMTNGVALEPSEYNVIIGTVLEVFVIVELFRIAVAYTKHQNVIPTVLEAALVAVARKFVVFEDSATYLQHALGLSALLIAVALSWFLLQRSHVTEMKEQTPG